MRYKHYFIILSALFITVSCNTKHNVKEEKHSLYRENNVQGQNEIGYFQYDPKDYTGKTLASTIVIDRALLAKHIASLVGELKGVEKVTTLVTDDHVFVGVRKTNKSMAALSEVKRTAESLTPRYFTIHITDKKRLEEKINAVGMRMRGNHDVEGVKGDLEQLLRDLGDETPPNVNESLQPSSRRDVNPTER